MRRLGVSNLAWPQHAEARALALLAEAGAQGVEVAPSRIAPWDEITPQRLAAFRAGCLQAGLAVSSLQAIFYGRPEAALLGDQAGFSAMCEQVRRVAGIAQALGAAVAVFGAPRSRLRGGLPPPDAMRLGAERLRRLGDLASAGGLTLAMEPVPPVYGADFLNHARDVVEIVREADHRSVRAHLDTACVSLAGDDVADAIRAAAPLLAHYHMAEPQLGRFAHPHLDHARAGATLDEVGYGGWVVIEMLAVERDDAPGEGGGDEGGGDEGGGDDANLAAIATAIGYARSHYAGA